MSGFAQRVTTTCLLALGVSTALAACGSSTASSEPQPGSTAPGGACTTASECGCWLCTCKGIGGDPGAAQLCVSGTCPSGEAACAMSCSLADTTVASVTTATSCEGRP